MTQEELKMYIKLNYKFNKECKRVTEILTKSKERTSHENSNICFAQTYRLDLLDGRAFWVFWEGDEYWNYGGHEHHNGNN